MRNSTKLYIGLPFVLALAALIGFTTWYNQATSPETWARTAPLQSVTVGSAEPRWTQLTDRIDEQDRQGHDINALLYTIAARPDNPDHSKMPVGYRQWLDEMSHKALP